MIFAISGYTGEFFGGLTKVIELYPNFASANELLNKLPGNLKKRKDYRESKN